jgi:signal transduction histidine kinase
MRACRNASRPPTLSFVLEPPPPSDDRPFADLDTRHLTVAQLARAARFALSLQQIAAALSSSLERDAVLTTIVRTTLEALGAAAGAVTECSTDGASLSVVSSLGYDDSLVRHFQRVRIDDFPAVAEVVRHRRALYIASQEEFEAVAPTIARHTTPSGARVALPLATSERFVGILVLTFAEARQFEADEREFLAALARQCAVALDRASLFERERTAREVAEAESARHSDSLERMSDLYFECDEEWRYVQINRAMRTFVRESGFDPYDLLGRSIWDVFPRLVGGAMHAAMVRARAEQATIAFEARGTYADSWYEGHAFPCGAGVGVHVRDTTIQRRAEDEVTRLTSALKRRVDEMETLLKVIPVGIGIANDPAATDVTVNPAMATLLRISTTDNASKTGPGADALPFRVLRDGQEMSSDDLPLQLAARSGRSLPYGEHELLFDDQTRVTLLASAAPILDDENRVRGSVGAFVDITARKRAEIASRILAEASAAFATSLDIARTFTLLSQRVVPEMADVCVIFVVRESGSVGVVAMESTDAATLQSMQAFDQVHPVDGTPTHPVWHSLRDARSILVPSVSDASIASMLSGEQWVIELARETSTTSLLMVPIATRGRVLGAMGMGTRGMRRRFDQGDLALAEELGRRAAMALDNAYLLRAEHRARGEAEAARTEAERASRAKSDFLAMMSHELRTPLNAIAGYAELIELGLRGAVTDAQVADLQKIRQNQRHLLGLINSVLSFARLDAGRVMYDLANVPVAASLRAVESLIEPQMRERKLQYHLRACDASITVRADSEKLQQILLNLLGNAAKFTAPGGRIDVSCTVEARQVRVSVRDSGVGIPAELFDRIFEPFVQANRTLRSSKEGVGLGLAISRELARGMGGELSVESVVGEGSTFTLMLPRGPDRTPLA